VSGKQTSFPTLAFLILATATTALSQPEPLLWGGLTPGSYDVGFTVVHMVDPSRSYGTASSRPIQVSLWYPVAKDTTNSSRMAFAEYVTVYLRPVTARDGKLSEADRRATFATYRALWFPNESEAAVSRLLNTPTFAAREAPAAPGRFPLIVYAPGLGGTPLTHTPAAEYLASHGYVVAMSPSQGGSPAGMPFDVAGQEEQLRDIEFTIGALRERQNIDFSKTGLIGFSFGGGAVILAAMRVSGISAVVSLDGTGAWDTTVSLVREANRFDPASFRAPLLVLKSDDETGEDLSIVRSLMFSDRRLIRLRGVEHHDFIPSPLISAVVNGKLAESARRGFPFTARTVLRFLDQHVRKMNVQQEQDLALDHAQPANPGEPASQFVLARIEAPTREELVSAVMERGDLNGLVEAQRALSREAPGIPLLSNGTMRMLALKFLDAGQKDEAITALQLLVDLYPGDAHMLNTLGDLYLARNERSKAAWYYAQSLSVRPGNGAATEGLRKLERLAR
jgi:hypothetical protein